ncbi:hypothetical protein CVD25_08615 [Bacillus canaveralius]|uniref:PAS domain-containing protein n=1 Tax=Bacillus canaveralius TaxID=1403243 RepID=A0A2N5GL19_9BACI|nr:PAS domain-containing protein [Bacillus canaveralius]PLR82214.1 hypothetical protein CU635_13725 [Bacillus canaveralius]PLR97880.1 hypothetical protein CVD25_08615 [Bacillus canaveralius]
MDLEMEHIQQIMDQLPDGIIVMNEKRVIYFMNLKARELTGWEIGDKVPYCTYCHHREVEDDEERCLK